jgi:hypothetical protein
MHMYKLEFVVCGAVGCGVWCAVRLLYIIWAPLIGCLSIAPSASFAYRLTGRPPLVRAAGFYIMCRNGCDRPRPC